MFLWTLANSYLNSNIFVPIQVLLWSLVILYSDFKMFILFSDISIEFKFQLHPSFTQTAVSNLVFCAREDQLVTKVPLK